MKHIGSLIAISVCLWFVSGCEAPPKGSFSLQKRQITIITEPEGATVIQLHPLRQPSTNLGITPIEDQAVIVVAAITRMKNMPYKETQELMKLVGNVAVKIEKEGYEPYFGTLKTEVGQTTIHRINLIPSSNI